MSNRIVGFCRFAFLGRGDWMGMQRPDATDAGMLAGRARMLFDPKRLRQRLFTLEHITLASIAGQTDQDFDFVILTSDSLPDEWKHRLAQLCDKVPQARLMVSDETDTNRALAPLLDDLSRTHGAPALQFRLDDDDAVGRRYIEKLRSHGRMLAELPRVAIGFPRGLSVITYEGAAPSFWQTHRGFTGAGAAARLQLGSKSIFALNHFSLPQRMPAFTDLSIMGHLVLRWDSGDTATDGIPEIPWGYEQVEETQFRHDLKQHFPFLSEFDWSRLRRSES
ncbi:glycosyltransferase [Paracoccus methylarcula]|uniref:Rhamnosyl transferase n=1 Tax=Paracoccus methylarcula TaxID=72022 RepID=A0A3R7SDF2_9RHOB|nr:glycosyltransferase [Paracoccus methylarcula]RNF35550.1 hypothetical protein A7A09_003795 [Paracoccus methylarcula]